MKKILFAVLTIALFVSCSKEKTLSTPETAAIEYDHAFVNNATKSATDFT